MRNIVETVQAIRDAQDAVKDWPADLWMDVVTEAPDCLQDVDTMTWCVTVQTFKTQGEPTHHAARRLALYLQLHHEAYGRTPRLASIQRNALARYALSPWTA